MLIHVFRFNWRDKLVLSTYSSIHIKSISIFYIYLSLSLFVLIFQVHCMWTEYTYIDPIFGTIRLYALNAIESPSRMHFVKGLVAIKGCSSVPNIKPDAQVHALTTFALTSFSRHDCAQALND